MKIRKSAGIAGGVDKVPYDSFCERAARLSVAMLALAALSACAAAQENTTTYWMNKAEEFAHNGSLDEAVSDDEALKIEPDKETVLVQKTMGSQPLGQGE